MNTSEIKTIKIKLLKAKTTPNESKTIDSLEKIYDAIDLYLNGNYDNEIYYTEIDQNTLDAIKEKYNATIHNSVRNGCYGSSTGAQYEGYTLFLPLELAQEYFSTEYQEFIVNPLHEIDCHGGEILDLTEEQIDGYLELNYQAGIDLGQDNSYNHEFDGCSLMCDFDFSFTGDSETDGPQILLIKFHCGGDIRGNYTRLYAFKFDSIDDLYGAILPSREIENEEK